MLDFEKSIEEFNRRNIGVIAASVDSLEDARETVRRDSISFKIGYGLNAEEVSTKTGAFYEGEKEFLHATGFIINPDGEIANGVYSTLAIGRLVVKDSLSLIDYFIQQKT